MELTRVPTAVSFSLHGFESGAEDVSIGRRPSPRNGVESIRENGSPQAGSRDRTSPYNSPKDAFVRSTRPEYSTTTTGNDGTGENIERKPTASETSPSAADARETAPDERRENESTDFQDIAALNTEGIEVRRLVQTDRKVRSHEQAHISAGGQYVVSGASYSYHRGPDGKLYAVGGEVSIDSSEIPGDPEATIRKMQQIRSAALAPSDPSSQDRAVAARASKIEARARQEAIYLRMEEGEDGSGRKPGGIRGRNPADGAGERSPQSGTSGGAEIRPDLDLYA